MSPTIFGGADGARLIARQGRQRSVLFVSAGLLQPKKRDHPLARRQLYLNYGALGLATLCEVNGLDTLMVHGEHEHPSALVQRLHQQGRISADTQVLLSIPSFYALEWSRLFCEAVKRADRGARIVVGGRWVTGPDKAWLQGVLPHADLIVQGVGEQLLPGLLDFQGQWQAPADCGLNHRLVEGFARYQPSIETSRGCGRGCAFCEERAIPLEDLKAPTLIVKELQRIIADYGDQTVRPYFQSSYLVPKRRWAEQLADQVQRAGIDVAWRCESRVDSVKPNAVAALATAGMKVIDLGLESASLQQLRHMNKAPEPRRYLDAASELLETCASHGIWVKLNVLLYAGETARTLDETRRWLDAHAQYFKGLSVGPVVVYGPNSHCADFLQELRLLGASPVDPASAQAGGVTQMHLSAELSSEQAELESLALSRRYMTQSDYFDLKCFSYYPRDYSHAQFERDVAACDVSRLPFRLPA